MLIGTTVAEATPEWPVATGAAQGRPNVVMVVLDDVGFSHLGCYGSDIATPWIDSLAGNGLRYSDFHATPVCSPTRAALLTGRNPHSVGMSSIAECSNGFPNSRGEISHEAGTLAEMLLAAGFSTFAVGKWHLAPIEHISSAGPYHQWPLGRGFERFYGFMGGATSHWNPDLVEDNHRFALEDRRQSDDYHLTVDLVDHAIQYIGDQKSWAPNKPFFLYLALGACHSPFHAPPEYISRYRGAFDDGWDTVRGRWLERQKYLGVVPDDTDLPPPNPDVPAWESLSEDERRLSARLQEAFAGFLTHADEQIGRLLSFLDQADCLDDTLLLLLSDNGATSFGGPVGLTNEMLTMNGLAQDEIAQQDRLDDIGGPGSYGLYSNGWGMAGNTPFKWYKVHTHSGGTRVPLIVHHPEQLGEVAGEMRVQYHHVVDLVPTVLDILGLAVPEQIRGVPQMPLHGMSMRYTFESSDSGTQRRVQYYECRGHRAIWRDGWKAVTRHEPRSNYHEERWELYRVSSDLNELHDLADDEPELLKSLVDEWWSEAKRYGVIPLDDRHLERVALRAPEDLSRSRFRLFPRASLHADAIPEIGDRSHSITADVVIPTGREEGVLICLGGVHLGFSLYVSRSRLCYAYNYFGVVNRLVSSESVPTGRTTLGFTFDRTARNRGIGRLRIAGRQVAELELETASTWMGFEPMDVGRDTQTAASPDYQCPFEFTGILHHVDVTLESDGAVDSTLVEAAGMRRQ